MYLAKLDRIFPSSIPAAVKSSSALVGRDPAPARSAGDLGQGPRHAVEKSADARYTRSSSGGGAWDFRRELPDKWQISYRDLRFIVHPTGFKHTGLFPEQAANWDFMMSAIQNAGRPISVLNLFGYTGGATVACAAAGARVCHVDAAKGMVAWAKDNAAASGLREAPIRYIVDDCEKFVAREIGARQPLRRHRHGSAELRARARAARSGGWRTRSRRFSALCAQVLTARPLFFIFRNAYTTGLQPAVLSNLLDHRAQKLQWPRGGAGSLPADRTGAWYRPCGAAGRSRREVTPMVPAIYEDNHLLIVQKPQNMPAQADASGDPDLLYGFEGLCQGKIQQARGRIPRARRIASTVRRAGVMAFARTSKAAARLSAQLQDAADVADVSCRGRGRDPGRRRALRLAFDKDERSNTSRVVSEGNGGREARAAFVSRARRLRRQYARRSPSGHGALAPDPRGVRPRGASARLRSKVQSKRRTRRPRALGVEAVARAPDEKRADDIHLPAARLRAVERVCEVPLIGAAVSTLENRTERFVLRTVRFLFICKLQ